MQVHGIGRPPSGSEQKARMRPPSASEVKNRLALKPPSAAKQTPNNNAAQSQQSFTRSQADEPASRKGLAANIQSQLLQKKKSQSELSVAASEPSAKVDKEDDIAVINVIDENRSIKKEF